MSEDSVVVSIGRQYLEQVRMKLADRLEQEAYDTNDIRFLEDAEACRRGEAISEGRYHRDLLALVLQQMWPTAHDLRHKLWDDLPAMLFS